MSALVTYGLVSGLSFIFLVGRRLFLGSNENINRDVLILENVFIGQSLRIGKVFKWVSQPIVL